MHRGGNGLTRVIERSALKKRRMTMKDSFLPALLPSFQSELFFKLHELQTCSWGASQIGRVAQTIDLQVG